MIDQCLFTPFQCDSQAEDFVELLDGNGMDPGYMWQDGVLCGLHVNAGEN